MESGISTGGGSDSLRGPATAESSVRADGAELLINTEEPNAGMGRQGVEKLDHIPKDATAR